MDLMNMTCSQAIDIKFKDLSYVVQIGYRGPKKQVLNNLNGFFRSTELTAIMGPSGAGKSTLLNILSGFQGDTYTGTVEYLNGDVKQNQKRYKKQLCYIQQENYLNDFFTAHEIMMIASYLKINQSISHNFRQALIDNILNALKLSHIKKTRVGQLSCGERNRLSIALELIDHPPIIFLDEPTTGLDSSASTQCITTLKTLAQAGRTIICTIHQPSAALYQMFDHIYLIVDGHCLYRAPPGDTIDYFARQGLQCPMYHNPADYMLEVVSKEYGDYSEQLIAAAKALAESDKTRSTRSSGDVNQEIFENNQTNSPTELMRLWVLLQRFVILAHRDRSKIYIKLVTNFFIGMIIGLWYTSSGNDMDNVLNNLQYLFSTVIYLFSSSMFSAAIRFPLEIKILQNEQFNNWYQLRTYYVAMLVYTIPLQIIFAFVYTFISYFVSDQSLEFSRFCKFFLITILINIVSESVGLVLGTILDPVSGNFLGSMILGVMISLVGYLMLFRHMSRVMYYISYLNVMRYTFDGLIQSVYSNRKLPCWKTFCLFGSVKIVLRTLDMEKPTFWLDVVVLLGYFVVLHILIYMLLKRRLLRRC